MARRRRTSDTGSLDSLLDTMFNVVGFLVLVMIFTQLSVQTAVQNITQKVLELPDISVKDLEVKEAEAEELREIVEKYKRLAQMRQLQMKQDEATKEQIEKEIAALKELVRMNPVLEAETKKIEQLVRERKEEMKKQQDALAEAMRQLELAKAMLDDTPAREVLPASTVSLPDPRVAPEGYTEKKIIIREGKVWPQREDDLFEAAKRLASQVRKIREDDENTGGLDPEIFFKVFEQRGPKTPDILLVPSIIGQDKNRIRLTYTRREDGGLSISEINETGSRYRKELVDAKQSRNYIRFYVYNDGESFSTYLTAREVVDEYDIPAGWALMHSSRGDEYKDLPAEFILNRKKKELEEEKLAREKAAEEAAKKPKPPPPPPKADTGPKIPPPKQTEVVPNAAID